MEKYFLILQPPNADKYRLLVDDISDNKTFGTTDDIHKVRYNRRLFGENFNMDIDIRLPLTDEGLTYVFPVGRFITILRLKKDESEGSMYFFDFNTFNDKSVIQSTLQKDFSERLLKEWFNIYDQLCSGFSDEEDVFELFLTD